MFVGTKDKPLATTVTGSLPRPSWYIADLDGRAFSVAMADRVYREQYLDTVKAYITDQNRAGLDILVDGDARFDNDVAGRSWFAYVLERLQGCCEPHMTHHLNGRLRVTRYPAIIMYEVVETRLPPYVTGKVERGHLEYDKVWKAAQAMTTKPMKIGGISGGLVEGMLDNQHYTDRRELIMDVSTALNQEYNDLADAGCPVIQIEEPAIHGRVGIVDDPILTPEFYVEAFNTEVKGLRDKTRGLVSRPAGVAPTPSASSTAISVTRGHYPISTNSDVDVLTFEAAENDGMDLEVHRQVGKQG